MNPCPCGYYGDPVKECTCSNMMVSRYQAHCWTGPASGRTIFTKCRGFNTKSCWITAWASPRPCFGHKTGAIRARVEAARERQGSALERGRPCACRGWSGGGAGPLPGGRRPCSW